MPPRAVAKPSSLDVGGEAGFWEEGTEYGECVIISHRRRRQLIGLWIVDQKVSSCVNARCAVRNAFPYQPTKCTVMLGI